MPLEFASLPLSADDPSAELRQTLKRGDHISTHDYTQEPHSLIVVRLSPANIGEIFALTMNPELSASDIDALANTCVSKRKTLHQHRLCELHPFQMEMRHYITNQGSHRLMLVRNLGHEAVQPKVRE